MFRNPGSWVQRMKACNCLSCITHGEPCNHHAMKGKVKGNLHSILLLESSDGLDRIMAVACVLVCARSTHRFLIQKRSKTLDQGNTYHVPSGYIESNEHDDPSKAAQRELQEETGYEGPVQMQHLYTTHTTPRNHPVYVYIGTVVDEFRTRCNWESTEQRWVNREALFNDSDLSPMHTGLTELLRSAAFSRWIQTTM